MVLTVSFFSLFISAPVRGSLAPATHFPSGWIVKMRRIVFCSEVNTLRQ